MQRRITFKHVLGICLLMTLNLIVWYTLTKKLPQENREIVIHSLGMLEGYIGAIVMYYYGDSAGSKHKTEIIKEHLDDKINNSNIPLDSNSGMGSETTSGN